MTLATQRHNSKRTLQVVSQISTITVLQIHTQYTALLAIFSRVIPNRPSPVRAPRHNAPLIRFLISALYTMVCLFILYASSLILFSSLFPYLSPPYLSFPLRTDPLRFEGRCHKRQLNLAIVLLCLFLCCSTFVSIGECVLLSR